MNGMLFPTIDDIQAQLEQTVNTLLEALTDAEEINALRGRLSELRTFVRSQQERVQTAYEERVQVEKASAHAASMSDAEAAALMAALQARQTVIGIDTINVETDVPKLGE